MKEKAMELILLAMKAEYDENAVLEIENLLKEIYETNDVLLKSNLDEDLNVEDYIYIPINVNNELHSFYQIKKIKGSFADLLTNTFSLVLSQMYTNIMYCKSNKKNEDEIDISTNVFNRNSFENFKRTYNYLDYHSVGIVFIDINEMNEINNQHGHLIGDKVILNVATLLKDIFKDDKVYRIGGDEFVVIATNKDSDLIEQMGLKVKNILNDNEIHVSVGICNGKNILDINCLINEADRLMFEDKKRYYEDKGLQLRKRYSKERTSSI